MINYAQMSEDEFRKVLDGCKTITDVTDIMESMRFRVSTEQIYAAKDLHELKRAKEEIDRIQARPRALLDMCSERMIELARQRDY